jgi:hypothetical protein
MLPERHDASGAVTRLPMGSRAEGYSVLIGIALAGSCLSALALALLADANRAARRDEFAFGAAAFVVMLGAVTVVEGLLVVRAARWEAAIRAKTPDEPWSWREDWAAGRAEGVRERSLALSWTTTALWSAFALVPLPAFLRGARPSVGALAIWAPFPVAGTLLLARAARMTIQRHGHTFLRLETVPAPLGRRLRGAVMAHLRRHPRGVRLTLTCVQVALERVGGRRRSGSERISWQGRRDVAVAELTRGPGGATSIPVVFDIPRDEFPTGADRSSTVRWLVRVQVDLPGVAFDEQYEVPVFETADSPDLEEWERTQDAESRSAEPPPRPTVAVRRAPEGAAIYDFGVRRGPGAAARGTLFLLALGALEAALMRGPVPPAFPIIFGALVAVFALIAIGLSFRRTRVVVGERRLRVERSVLALRSSRSWAADDLFSVTCATRWGRGPRGAPRYDLIALRGSTEEIVLVPGLLDEGEVEWIAQEIRRELGMRDEDGDEEGDDDG